MTSAPLHADVRFWRDPLLPGVEVRTSSYTRQAFRTHTHPEYSVGLVEQGSTRFTLNGAARSAAPGQMVVIHPGEPHACNPDAGSGISYRMFYLAPCWLRRAAEGAQPRFPEPVLDDAELFRAWVDLHEAFVAGPAADRRAMLLACLRELVLRHARRPQACEEATAVATARQLLAASPGRRIPLAELARETGLSPHHFLRVFKFATGLPPHAYQLQQAVDQGKALLAAGQPISQAALATGFADQSHFSRLFRQFTGATPRQYREACGFPNHAA